MSEKKDKLKEEIKKSFKYEDEGIKIQFGPKCSLDNDLCKGENCQLFEADGCPNLKY